MATAAVMICSWCLAVGLEIAIAIIVVNLYQCSDVVRLARLEPAAGRPRASQVRG